MKENKRNRQKTRALWGNQDIVLGFMWFDLFIILIVYVKLLSCNYFIFLQIPCPAQ